MKHSLSHNAYTCAVLVFVGCGAAPDQVIGGPDGPRAIDSIYWSDGDSGRLNGSIKFRLNVIDAPETGGVGAAIGGAKCEEERALGYQSKEWVVNLTRDAVLEITAKHGTDRHGRLVIDLAANGQDVAESGLASGTYRSWKHDGKKALEPRPDWCKL